jgi:hypothetical protein
VNKLMIDLETLGTSRIDAPVVAIGVAVFNDEQVIHTAGWNIAPPWSGSPDSRTILWWMSQSKEAQQATFATEGRVLPYLAWNEFMAIVHQFEPKTVWANDPDFDVVLLQNWLAREQARPPGPGHVFAPAPLGAWPFQYNQYRAYRTLREIAGEVGWTDEMNGAARGMYVAHNPIEDAASQARAVIAMRRFITNGHATLYRPHPLPSQVGLAS